MTQKDGLAKHIIAFFITSIPSSRGHFLGSQISASLWPPLRINITSNVSSHEAINREERRLDRWEAMLSQASDFPSA